jgi:uncharacterized metal-binding protein YceD (DUF177 family)
LPSLKWSVMLNRRTYELAFVGLKPGIHVFEYALDKEFFSEKGVTDIPNMNAQVKMTLDKHVGFFLLKFEVSGQSDGHCDRCGNPLKLDLWDEFNMVVKLVDDPEAMNNQEEDPDVFYIARNESHLNVENWLYEFVMLSIPLQQVCPTDEQGNSTCNAEVLAKLQQMKHAQQDQATNALWKGLDRFKEN